ncbi:MULTISPECIES: hypothetical protein [Haloprofundus]|uniref:hypothetical protein n=1 Tax=Haloprofundus TaxID=1911573 RepID=UPI000E44D34B|nr:MULTISPECIES: hypothetical protein [Haloprofundus]QCJ47973.1 hypothetical protein FCF25_12985 [Haloprofundus sp. MHR1]
MTKDDRYGAAGDTYGDVPANVENGAETSTPDGEPDAEAESAADRADASAGSDAVELPFIFARRTVKADRDALPVYVRPTTAERLDALERELADRFDGDDVMSLDVREAVVTAGLRNVGDVVDVMEEWGYGRR